MSLSALAVCNWVLSSWEKQKEPLNSTLQTTGPHSKPVGNNVEIMIPLASWIFAENVHIRIVWIKFKKWSRNHSLNVPRGCVFGGQTQEQNNITLNERVEMQPLHFLTSISKSISNTAETDRFSERQQMFLHFEAQIMHVDWKLWE